MPTWDVTQLKFFFKINMDKLIEHIICSSSVASFGYILYKPSLYFNKTLIH